MSRFAVLLFLVLSSIPLAIAQTTANKLVVQVSDADPARWNMVLNNVKNVQAELGKDVQIEIVAYGPGVNMLKFDAVTAGRVAEAVKSGVQVVACENTLTTLKIPKTDMHSDIGYVAAGAVEIMRKQQQGWAYLRP
jgi:uncharacterized protein